MAREHKTDIPGICSLSTAGPRPVTRFAISPEMHKQDRAKAHHYRERAAALRELAEALDNEFRKALLYSVADELDAFAELYRDRARCQSH